MGIYVVMVTWGSCDPDLFLFVVPPVPRVTSEKVVKDNYFNPFVPRSQLVGSKDLHNVSSIAVVEVE